MKFSRHFNFAGFLNKFWISLHFKFAVKPKYYILRHFNFAVWPKYYNLRFFNFVVVLKIEFFKCVRFQHFRNFEKSTEPKCKLKYVFTFFYTPLIHKSIKNTRKTFFLVQISSSSSSESTTGFTNPNTWRSSSGVSRKS